LDLIHRCTRGTRDHRAAAIRQSIHRHPVADNVSVDRSPDYILEIGGQSQAGEATGRSRSPRPTEASLRGRPWLSVYWRCCRVYSRIYRNAEATAYIGACPRCRSNVRARIGPGGVRTRFFTAEP
jgi:hypothetical protein